jgi:nitrous oxide reductase accessory protein NosL
MKRTTGIVRGLLAAALTFGLMAAACGGNKKPNAEKDFRVKLNDAGDSAVITGYLGPGGNIIIPASIQGIPVREIGGFIVV